tara:strand:+ start:150 stop:464 length:315 start_codon:yes stop_codon:yes gene_type:complete
MTKIGGYVSMSISDQYVQCLACGEEVRVESIDNLLDISPSDYTIILNCEPCKCGFRNVLEYAFNAEYSHGSSVAESNDNEDGVEWVAQRTFPQWKINRYEEGEE